MKILEYSGTLFAILGAGFLATGFEVIGYMLFLVSGFLLIPLHKLCQQNALIIMQSVFFIINIVGLTTRL